VARVERLRLRLVDLEPVTDPDRAPAVPGLWPWLTARLRERATWRELGYALLFAGLLWPVDALVVAVELFLPTSMVATPVLMATVGDGEEAKEAKVLKQWTVTNWPAAFGVSLVGLLLLLLCAYVIGVAAGARGGLTRLLIGARDVELGERVVDALLRVAAGGTVVDPEVVRQLLRRRRDPLERLDPARTRGARADGGGPVQRLDRPRAGGLRGGRRQAHREHSHQARPASGGRDAPPGAGRAGVSEGLGRLATHRLLAKQRLDSWWR